MKAFLRVTQAVAIILAMMLGYALYLYNLGAFLTHDSPHGSAPLPPS